MHIKTGKQNASNDETIAVQGGPTAALSHKPCICLSKIVSAKMFKSGTKDVRWERRSKASSLHPKETAALAMWRTQGYKVCFPGAV